MVGLYSQLHVVYDVDHQLQNSSVAGLAEWVWLASTVTVSYCHVDYWCMLVFLSVILSGRKQRLVLISFFLHSYILTGRNYELRYSDPLVMPFLMVFCLVGTRFLIVLFLVGIKLFLFCP